MKAALILKTQISGLSLLTSTKYAAYKFSKVSHSTGKDEMGKYNPEKIGVKKSYIELMPKLIRPYLRLSRIDRPIGWVLLFLPCMWGLAAGYPYIDAFFLKNAFLFLSGSVVMRSCGCVINDIWDRDIDKKVERTKQRPIASGEISVSKAIIYAGLHFGVGLWILTQLSVKSIIAGFCITPLFIIYPLMKRVTNFPQFFLGLCFNSGVFVGYFTYYSNLDPLGVLPLYFAGILWTLVYDTIYGHMDKSDDKNVGVKSTALFFADKTKLVSYFLIATILGLVLYYIETEKKLRLAKVKGYLNYYWKDGKSSKDKILLSLPYLIIGLGALYQAFIIRSSNLNSPLSCLNTFKKSTWYGLAIALSIASNNFAVNTIITNAVGN